MKSSDPHTRTLQNRSTSTQIRADTYMAPGTPTMDGCPATPHGAGPGTPGMHGGHGTPGGRPQTDFFIVDKTLQLSSPIQMNCHQITHMGDSIVPCPRLTAIANPPRQTTHRSKGNETGRPSIPRHFNLAMVGLRFPTSNFVFKCQTFVVDML